MIERRRKPLSAVASLFDEVSDGVFIADAAGNVLYSNPAALRLLELKQEPGTLTNVCGMLCGRLTEGGPCGGAEACPLRVPGSIETAVTYSGKHGPHPGFAWGGAGVRRADRYKDLRLRCMKGTFPFAGVEGELHLIFVEDATSENELARHKEDWRAMIAHDLRTPLTSIYAGLRVLEDAHPGRGKTDPDAEVVRMGVRACRRMMELLDLYLDVARIDAGRAPVKLEATSVFEAVDDAASDQGALAATSGVLLEIDVPPTLRATADAELLARVIENLVNNALKYGATGGKVKVSAREEGDHVLVGVEDQGPGIAERDLPMIFDRYYQSEARRAGRIKGNGLGLTFCKEAMRLMRGEIEVSSKPGTGTTFTLRLPKASP